MELKEKIFDFVYNSKLVRQKSIMHLINQFKEEGFSEEEVREALYALLRERRTYELPESVCLLE